MNIPKPNTMAYIVCGTTEFYNTRGTIVMAVCRRDMDNRPGWRLDRRLYSADGKSSFNCIGDCCLRPLKDLPPDGLNLYSEAPLPGEKKTIVIEKVKA